MAQTHQHQQTPADGRSFLGQAFLTANLQVRKFTDFYQFESQNWFVAEAARTDGRRTLRAHAMLSLEPLTLRGLGSAQAFQTGETLDGAPLIDYQHPHDLFMGLEAQMAWRAKARTQFRIGGGPVGAAALGPEPFMHRRSATDNPTVPLSHHQLDSTHIAPECGDDRATHRSLSFDASAFKGREPDEERRDLDVGVPDSWSARMSWSHAQWRAQVSGGRLHQPEPNEPFDVTRLTASVSYEGTLRGSPLAVTLAAGRNREFYGDVDAMLAEATLHLGAAEVHSVYMRAELVEKNILTAGGLHPPGFTHPHELSRVGAITLGYARTLARGFGIGGDVTRHAVPSNLRESYGRPASTHIYLRWRGSRSH